MSPLSKAIVPFVAGFVVVASAQAQLLLTWETPVTLKQQDLDMIRSAVTNEVHGKPVGTATSWSNPASGNAGSIRLVKKLTRKAQQCEDIEYLVRSGGRRSTLSTIISSAAYNRTEPGKSRKVDGPGSRRIDPLQKRKIFDPRHGGKGSRLNAGMPTAEPAPPASLNDVDTLQPNMLGVRIVGIL
jgi:hypothetical protein